MVPETANSGALEILSIRAGVRVLTTFHSWRIVGWKFLKEVGKRIPEAEIWEEPEALNINEQALMELHSDLLDQYPEDYGPLTLHLITLVTRGSDFAKVCSLTDLCGLRVNVKTHCALRGPLQFRR
jgi:hypothetical protein